MEETLRLHDRMWQWFSKHAESHYVLVWLFLVAFADAFISPLPTELFLVALMVAQPQRWKLFLSISIIGALLGAALGYFIGHILFQFIGLPIITFYHLQNAFAYSQHFLRGHVFLTMAILPFVVIIPEKVFIYAAGFLGIHFWLFMAGYFVGQSIRITLVTYLAGKYGRQVTAFFKDYILIIGVLVLAAILIYGIVQLHLLPL